MARADLLKKLFQCHRGRDEPGFMEAADELIQEERKKHHPVVASELERILKNGSTASPEMKSLALFDPPPRDTDRKTSLLEIRQPSRYLGRPCA